ncbi:peptidyl-prolyl cis-trans isomerase [Thermodesulfobacteriota bacterium]
MHRLIRCFLVLFIVLGIKSTCHAWFWGGDNPLVVINGQNYTTDDFRHWWNNWKDADTSFPEAPDSFIDWQLRVQEARNMELYKLPSYQRKVDVFLRVRSRLLLKREEIDTKHTITEEEIRARYDSMHNPVWHVRVYYYDDEHHAMIGHETLSGEKMSPELYLNHPPANAGLIQTSEKKLTPESLKNSAELIPVLRNTAINDFLPPVQVGQHYAVLQLIDLLQQDESHFESQMKRVRKVIRRENELRLTDELITRLKEKYKVRVDSDLLELPLESEMNSDVMMKPLVLTSQEQMPYQVFYQMAIKDRKLSSKTITADEIKEQKQKIVEAIIFDFLVRIESINRHYEEKPPLKWTYQFYQGNRLIKELENTLIKPEISVGENEIIQYYQDNINNYMEPAEVTYTILRDDAGLADKIWSELTQGKDFFDIAKKYYQHDLPIHNQSIDTVDPDVKIIIDQLAVGEVSSPIISHGKKILVKLINKKKSEPQPLEKHRGAIRENIFKEKLKAIRLKFNEKLRQHSEIKVNKKKWKTLREELGGQDDVSKK